MKSRRTAELDPESTVSLVFSCGSRLPSLRAVAHACPRCVLCLLGGGQHEAHAVGSWLWFHPTCFLSWTPAVLGAISTQVFIELY